MAKDDSKDSTKAQAQDGQQANAQQGTTYIVPQDHKKGSSWLALIIGIIVAAVLGWLASAFGVVNIAIGTIVAFLVYLALAIRVLPEWKRSPVLTLGRYSGIYGPGIFLIIPFIQNTPYTFDLRTLSKAFSAEKTLTSDNVTVDVDAIMFSRIENPERTVLQVTDVESSVTLAAQTALRDIIGKVDLSKMIQGRTEIANEVKTLIDERVLPWGVNVISVEIRDVRIPADLQDAMAKVAIASRERDARVVLADSERLAAVKMIQAADMYKNNMYAMQLRALNMLYEVGISGKNTLIFVPTESRGLGMPTPIGVFGLSEVESGRLLIPGQGKPERKPKQQKPM